MTCSRCPHAAHVGHCAVEYDVQGIEQTCMCVSPTERTANRFAMRGDALVKEAEMGFLQKQEPRPKRYPKRYRRI